MTADHAKPAQSCDSPRITSAKHAVPQRYLTPVDVSVTATQREGEITMQITDHGHDDPIAYDLTLTDRAIAAAARKARQLEVHMLNTRDKLRREQAEARAMHEQAVRDYHFHNRTLDGQS